MSIELFLDRIENEQIREALRRVENEINNNPLTNVSWESIEGSLRVGANLVKHGLGGVPTHFVISFIENPEAEVMIVPTRSTREAVLLVTDISTRVRLLVGG